MGSWFSNLHMRKTDEISIEKVCNYDTDKLEELTQNKGIIRNKRKIKASVENSRIFKAITAEFGSFYNYLRTFTKGDVIYETDKTTNELSDRISIDLQSRGMTFVGSTIIYSYLQAIGVIYSHDKECFMHKMIFQGISRDFSLIGEDQYNTIGAFWDEMSEIYGLENLRGLGYNWRGTTMSYAIGLKSGAISGSNISINLPTLGWEKVRGLTENLKEIYDKVYTGGRLDYEIELFFEDGSCEIEYHRR